MQRTMSQEEFDEPEKSFTEGFKPKINDVAQKFLADLDNERLRLGEDFPLCAMLIDEAFDRVYSTGRIPGREFYADVYKQKPIKITQKVFVPTKQYPTFNFTGKILGPKGNSLRRLQDETQCKIVIKGRGSMRDRNKEEELRNSGDPKFAHLNRDIYLEISTVSTPAESYARLAYALAEIRKFIIPDKNDEVSHAQLRELMEINPEMVKSNYAGNGEAYKSVLDKTRFKGTPKYFNVLNHAVYEPGEEVIYEDNHLPPKHLMGPNPYDYPPKAPTSSAAAKRHSVMNYLTETKRVREVPPKLYAPKPHPYVMVKKFK